MSVTLERAGRDAARDVAELLRREWPTGWEPRPSGEDWWQTRQSRDELVARLSGLFISPNNGRPRDKIRRRGLNRLLDWLEQQPGETWQERWLASGATRRDATGPICRCEVRTRPAIIVRTCAPERCSWSAGRSSAPPTAGCSPSGRH